MISPSNNSSDAVGSEFEMIFLFIEGVGGLGMRNGVLLGHSFVLFSHTSAILTSVPAASVPHFVSIMSSRLPSAYNIAKVIGAGGEMKVRYCIS